MYVEIWILWVLGLLAIAALIELLLIGGFVCWFVKEWKKGTNY